MRRPTIALVQASVIAIICVWYRRYSLARFFKNHTNSVICDARQLRQLRGSVRVEERIVNWHKIKLPWSVEDVLGSIDFGGLVTDFVARGLLRGHLFDSRDLSHGLKFVCSHIISSCVRLTRTSGKLITGFITGSSLSLSSIGTCHPDLAAALLDNSEERYCILKLGVRTLMGETVRVFFPLEIANRQRNYTVVTRSGIDMIAKVEACGNETFHPIPDYRNGIKFNLFRTGEVTYHVNVRLSSVRDGDHLLITSHGLEYGIGSVPVPTGLRMSCNDGHRTMYARGFSRDGELFVSLCTAPYISTVVTAKDLNLARLRSGTKIVDGQVKYVPNTGLLNHNFVVDGNPMGTEDLTHLVSFVGSGSVVDIFEILPHNFINEDWPGDGVFEREVVSEGKSGGGSSRMSAITDMDTGDDTPVATLRHPKDSIGDALPLKDRTDHPLGSSLTNTDGDITRVVLEDGPAVEERPVGRQVTPPLTTSQLTVAATVPAENRLTKEVRVDPFVNDGPEPGSAQATEVQRSIKIAVDILLGGSRHTGAPASPEDLVMDAKPSVKVAVERDRLLQVPPDTETFIKRDVIGRGKAGRQIVSAHPFQRVKQATLVKGIEKAIEKTFYKTKVYGFGDAESLSTKVRRLHAVSKEKGYPIMDIDVEKLDASINWLIRWMENYVAKYVMQPKYHEMVDSYFAEIYSKNPRTKGAKTDLRMSRRSGEPGTSLWNTLACAIIMMTYLLESCDTVSEARYLMGITAGDDAAVVCRSSPEKYKEVAQRFGLKLTIDVRPLGTPNMFLAVWYCSVMDIFYPEPRYLDKGFVNNYCSVDDRVVIRRRAQALIDSWGDSLPLLSNIARAVIRLTPETVVNEHEENMLKELLPYRERFFEGAKLKTAEGSEEIRLVGVHYAEQLGIPFEKLIHLSNKYDLATKFEDFPHEEIGELKWPDSKLPRNTVWRAQVLKGAVNEVNHSSTEGSKSVSKNRKPNAQKSCVKKNKSG